MMCTSMGSTADTNLESFPAIFSVALMNDVSLTERFARWMYPRTHVFSISTPCFDVKTHTVPQHGHESGRRSASRFEIRVTLVRVRVRIDDQQCRVQSKCRNKYYILYSARHQYLRASYYDNVQSSTYSYGSFITIIFSVSIFEPVLLFYSSGNTFHS